MSILDRHLKIDTLDTGARRTGDPQPAAVTMSQLPLDREVYNGFTYEQGYETRVLIATRWFANQAQYSDRSSLARREILHLLYGPVLHRLHELKARAFDRDYRELLRVVNEIEKELME